MTKAELRAAHKGNQAFAHTGAPVGIIRYGRRTAIFGFFFILFPLTLIANPLSMVLYNNGQAFKTSTDENGHTSTSSVTVNSGLFIQPRALFLASLGVYCHAMVSGLFQLILAIHHRSTKGRGIFTKKVKQGPQNKP